jgi:hypothetical protein
MRRSWAGVATGALLGAAVGGAALLLWPPAAEHASAGAAEDLYRRAARAGVSEGAWHLYEPMRERTRRFVRDPSNPSVIQVHLPEQPNLPLPAWEDELTRHLLGNVDAFLRAYRASGAPAFEDSPVGRMASVEWRKAGLDGCAVRRLWVEVETGRVARIEDRTAAGEVFRSVAWLGRDEHERAPRPLPAPRERPSPRLDRRAVPDFLEFVRRVPMPVYEPATLPPGFERDDYAFDDRPPPSDRAGGAMPIAWVSYTDGLVRMNLFLSPPDQMRRLEALARRADAGPGPSACPSTPADAPEELLELSEAVVVRRTADGCRTVLRRDDLDGVVVALVGYPGLPADAWVRTIQSLVRVSARPRPGEEPLRPVGGDR